MSHDALSMVLGALVRLERNLAKVQDDLAALRADAMACIDRHGMNRSQNRRADKRSAIRLPFTRPGGAWRSAYAPYKADASKKHKTFDTNEKALAR